MARKLRPTSVLGAATRCLVLAIMEPDETAQPILELPRALTKPRGRHAVIKPTFTRKRPRLV